MTTVLPKDVKNFKYDKNIWVTDHNSVIGLATALRLSLIQIANTKMAAVSKNEKMEVLYGYLTGVEFKQRVKSVENRPSPLKWILALGTIQALLNGANWWMMQ